MSHQEIGSRLHCRVRAQPARTFAFLRTVVWICLLLSALPVVACTQSKGPTSANPYKLIAAKYPDCQQQGQAMARYLDTGQPALYDAFGWTDLRQTTQSLSGGARSKFIQQQANAFIQQCDVNVAAQKATEPVAEQEAAVALQVKEQSTCEGLGATWRWGVCYISYVSPNDGNKYYYTVTFDDSGTVIPGPGPQNAAQCAHYGDNIQSQWHPDTEVCSL